jgi:hypothetical protein
VFGNQSDGKYRSKLRAWGLNPLVAKRAEEEFSIVMSVAAKDGRIIDVHPHGMNRNEGGDVQ